MRRTVDTAVCSDVHLGTPHCRADALLAWLDAIDPRRLVLNGDIVDLERMGRWSWPAVQREVAGRLLSLAEDGVETWFITGNHDAALRSLAPARLGAVRLADRLELTLGGIRTLLLHGDRVLPRRRWHRLVDAIGGAAYDAALLLDRGLRGSASGHRSLVAAVKERVPGVAAHIASYERRCAESAWKSGCAAVVVGHIHQPRIRRISWAEASVLYLNSGDWVEHATALEWDGAAWSLADADGPLMPAHAAIPVRPSTPVSTVSVAPCR